MENRKYRLFLYRPEAANFAVNTDEHRAQFIGELKANDVRVEIRLQDISTLSFTLPENILGEFNTRLDDVLENYIIELWYGKLEGGTLGPDSFPEFGDRLRFVIKQSALNYSDGIKRYSYEANSLEHFLEFKQIFNWPGIRIRDYYRTIRYDKVADKLVEVGATVGTPPETPTYTILESTNTNKTKYITIPTTFGLTVGAPEPFEIFMYQYRRNTDDTVNSENSIVEFSGTGNENNELFKEGFYVPVLNEQGKIISLKIALPDNINNATTGFKNPTTNAIFEIFLYDNPLKRKLTTITESTSSTNEVDQQIVQTAQNVPTRFNVDLYFTQGSNILKSVTRADFDKLDIGQKITGTGVFPNSIIENLNPANQEITISSNMIGSGTNERRTFQIITEGVVLITPVPPAGSPTINYSFSSQLIYSIHGLKLEEILLGLQQTRTELGFINNSALTIDGLLYNTGFTIGTIHQTIEGKFRSNLEFKNITAYQAIKNLAESFDCIAVFNSVNKTVSFFPDKNEQAFTNNGLIITRENYLKNINNNIDATKIITKSYAAGKDNLGIQLINPTGSAAWEDYSYFLDDYYIDNADLFNMSQNSTTGLSISFPNTSGYLSRWIDRTEAEKIAKWQYTRDYFHNLLLGIVTYPSISAYTTRYFNLYQLRDTALATFVKEETKYYEIKATEFKYKAMWESYVKINKTTPTSTSAQSEIDFKKKYDDAVAASNAELRRINILHYGLFGTRIDGTVIKTGDADFTLINAASANSFATKFLEIQNFLNKASAWGINVSKIKPFEKEAVMTDSKIDNELELIEALQEFVKENCVPVVTIDIGIADFLASYQSQIDWNKVKIGDIVNIYYPDFNIDTSAQLREISIDFQSNTLSFIISTYRQYGRRPLNYIARQIRQIHNDSTNKLIYDHDSNVIAARRAAAAKKQLETVIQAAQTNFETGATSTNGEASTIIAADGFTSRPLQVDDLLEVFIFKNEKTLRISDGTLTAVNIVRDQQDVIQYVSEVEVSGDNGFMIRKTSTEDGTVLQVYIDPNTGNAVFAGELSIGTGPVSIDEFQTNILTEAEDYANGIKTELQGQIDGAISTFFANGTPLPIITDYTGGTAPSNPQEGETWYNGSIYQIFTQGAWVAGGNDDIDSQTPWPTNDSEAIDQEYLSLLDFYIRHVGDLYYDNDTGYSYRFTKKTVPVTPDDSTNYIWTQISDSAATAALEAASTAQLTADGKMTIFYAANSTELQNATNNAEEGDLLIIGGTTPFQVQVGGVEVTYSRNDSFTFNASGQWIKAQNIEEKDSGSVGGWKIDSTNIKSINNTVFLNSGTYPHLSINQSLQDYNEEGIYLGMASISGFNKPVLSLVSGTGPGANYLRWNGTNLELSAQSGSIGGATFASGGGISTSGAISAGSGSIGGATFASGGGISTTGAISGGSVSTTGAISGGSGSIGGTTFGSGGSLSATSITVSTLNVTNLSVPGVVTAGGGLNTIVTNPDTGVTTAGPIQVGSATIAGTLSLPQNTVGTTFGNGVGTDVPFKIRQIVGDNDAWSIYGESAATNTVTMVFQLEDDIETAATSGWLFRNKKTYGDFIATTPMFIRGDGNVGIGTTSPTAKLHVNDGKGLFTGNGNGWNETNQGTTTGAIHLGTSSASSHVGDAITFGARDNGSGLTAQAGIYTRTDGTYGTKMYLATTDSYAAGSKTRLFINSNGNVGIGTISPADKLTIQDGNLRLYNTGNLNPAIAFSNFGVSSDYPQVALIQSDGGVWGGNLSIQTKPNGASTNTLITRVYIRHDGNVGIGTEDPSTYKLFVEGSQYISGSLYFASDSRLKNKIEVVKDIPILSAIENIDIWKFSYKNNPKQINLGLMAQDVLEFLPQLSDQLIKVEESKKEGIENPLSLNENKLVYVLWSALQEQIKINKNLEYRIEKLEKGGK